MKKRFFPVLFLSVQLMLFSCGNDPGKKEKGEMAADTTAVDEEKPGPVMINTLDSIPLQTYPVNITDAYELVVAAKGSAYILPKNCFLDENDQPVNAGITVEIKELNSLRDFIKGGISTLSNGQLLYTAGSYYFNATANGKTLKINPKNKPIVMYPARKKDKNMRYFKGEMTAEGDINWVEEKGQEEVHFMDPLNFTEIDAEYERVICFINGLKEYKKSGTTWEYNGKSGNAIHCIGFNTLEDWYVKDMKRKHRYITLFMKRRKDLVEAYKKYAEGTGDAQLEGNSQLKNQLIDAGVYDPYQYEMNQLGWANCDAYMGREKQNFVIHITTASKKKGMAYVHIVGPDAGVHIKKFTEQGQCSVEWPLDEKTRVIAYNKNMKKVEKELVFAKTQSSVTLCLPD